LASSIPARVPKFPADLKRNGRFPGTGGHREKNAAFPGNDRFNCAIDRDLLVIPLALFERKIYRRQQLLDLCVVRQRFTFPKSLPEFFRSWIRFDLCFFPSEVIKLENLRTVAGVGEVQAEH